MTHRVADALRDRHGLAGDHAFVHGTQPTVDLTVGGEARPGSDAEQVTRLNLAAGRGEVQNLTC